MAKRTVKGPKGKKVVVAEKVPSAGAQAAALPEKIIPAGSKVEVESLFEWFKTTYPNNQPVDRDNGRTFHLKGKKVVKMPTQENKGGCFFGKHLNPHFKRLKDHLGTSELVVHTKGNYKVAHKVKIEVLNGIKWVIATVYPPREFTG